MLKVKRNQERYPPVIELTLMLRFNSGVNSRWPVRDDSCGQVVKVEGHTITVGQLNLVVLIRTVINQVSEKARAANRAAP